MTDWSKVFERAQPEKGATEAEVKRFVATLGRPLSRAEIAEVNRFNTNPFPEGDPNRDTWQPFDAAAWVMPAHRPVPPSYLSFVRYSDGGHFRNGDRLFQMYGTGLRQMMLDRLVPEYMPLAVPFAFNGGGVMYMFDMRQPPDADGEYPIICAHAGCLDFDPRHAPKVADSFPEVCRGRFNVERLRHGGVVLTAEQWPTCTDPKPMLDECQDRPRKLRLFACACARRIWHLIPDKLFREAVELAERYADGEATDKKRKALKEECEALARTPAWTTAAAAATNCLSTDASGAAWNGAWGAASAEAIAESGTHEGPAMAAARARQADLLREVFGNPLRPVRIDPAWLKWNRGTVRQIAERIYQQRSFADMPVLADALEEAGCTDAEILAHCREAREHVPGCWMLDLLRGADS